MTPTATDRLTVHAETARDAQDVARRRWESFGFRVLRVLEVEPRAAVEGGMPEWRVTAEVEVIRVGP